MSDYKHCPRCDEDVHVDHFQKNSSKKDGLQGYCKPCMNSYIGSSDLQKGAKIYVLRNKKTGEQYVGSTTKTVRKRLWNHMSAANAGGTSRLYRCMQVFNDTSLWDIRAVEFVETGDREELREREQSWIDELSPVLNTHNAIREVRA
jgi:hypothetical protein